MADTIRDMNTYCVHEAVYRLGFLFCLAFEFDCPLTLGLELRCKYGWIKGVSMVG